MLERDNRNGIEIVRIRHGKANAIDAELLEELETTLRALADAEVRAVVLTGTGSIFSAGVDLFRVLEGAGEYLSGFLPVLSRALAGIASFPKPLVAAINGHAIAGGCVLACACDHKLMARGAGRIGVPELQVGVPFPAAPLEIMRMVVPARFLQEVVYLGRTYEPEAARERGLVDEVVDAEVLETRALELAEALAAIAPAAFALTKRQLRRPLLARMERTAELFDGEVDALWQAEESHAVIRAYLEKTIRR